MPIAMLRDKISIIPQVGPLLCSGACIAPNANFVSRPRHLHSSVCFVQCPVLFSGTLLDNLDPGRIHTVDEVWAALAAVNYYSYGLFSYGLFRCGRRWQQSTWLHSLSHGRARWR